MISGFYLMRWMSETVFFNLTFSDIRTSFIILILETGRAQPIPAIDLLTKSSVSAFFASPLYQESSQTGRHHRSLPAPVLQQERVGPGRNDRSRKRGYFSFVHMRG